MAGSFFCNDDNIVAPREIGLVLPVEFSDPSLDPVPCNRDPYLFADGDPQSRYTQPVLSKNDRKMRCVTSFAQSI